MQMSLANVARVFTNLAHACIALGKHSAWSTYAFAVSVLAVNNIFSRLQSMCRMFTILICFCIDNSCISSRCGKYLQVFKHLMLLNVSRTSVKVLYFTYFSFFIYLLWDVLC